MKKFKSKKAFTLVELVVTVTIIAIVSGFGVGIFASTISNYMTASVTGFDQQKANQIEQYILQNTVSAERIVFLSNPEDPDAVLDSVWSENFMTDKAALKTDTKTAKKNINLITCKKTSASLQRRMVMSSMYREDTVKNYSPGDTDNVHPYGYYDVIVRSNGDVKDGANIDLDGFKEIRFSFVRVKSELNTTENSCFYLKYNIIMDSGYSLEGGRVVNNIDTIYLNTDESKYVESSIEFTVGSDTADTGIAFVQRNHKNYVSTS